MKNLLSLIIVFGLIAVGWYLNDRQDRVITFNDQLVDILDESNAHYEGYLVHLNKYYDGEQVDIEKMRMEFESLDKKSSETLNRARQMTVPEFPACSEYHSVFIKYLDNNSEIIAAHGEVTQYIAEHNPGTNDDMVVLDNILNPFIAKDDELFQAITVAQGNLAEEYDFKLE